MKKLVFSALTLAAVALFAQPAFAAEHTHDHGNVAQAAPEGTVAPAGMMCDHESMVQESLQKMRAQMSKINQTKDPKKRQKLLQEHNKSMRDSIKILREMMAEMAMGSAPGAAMPGRMMGGNRAGDRMMGGNMTGMKCDHMKGEPLASQPDDSVDAASVARSNPDQAAASGNASSGPAKKLWICPMHPDEIQDHPGTCRACGMDLVDKEELDAPFSGQSPTKGAMKCDHKMGGMKDCCIGGDGVKCDQMMGGAMKCDHNMGGLKGCCMSGDGAKCDHKMGGMKSGYTGGSGMKCDHKMGGKRYPMMGMAGRHMGAILTLMEQMLAHNEAAMAIQK